MNRSPLLARYVLAMVSCLVAITLLWLSGEASPLLAAITAICVYGGRSLGLLAIGICGIALGCYFLPSAEELMVMPYHWLRLAIFVAIAVVVHLLLQDELRSGLGGPRHGEISRLMSAMPWPGQTADGRSPWHTPMKARGEAQDAVESNERRLRLLVETVPALICCANADGAPSYFNRRTLDYVGLTGAELMRSPFRAVHPEDAAALKQGWRQSVETGSPFTFTYRLRRADGVFRWHEVRAEPLRDPSGAVIQWLGVTVDIDESKRGEQALQAMNARLARASQLASLAELSASIAHEVSQPLAAVVTNGYACERWLSEVPPNLERARLTIERIILHANAAADVVARVRALFRQGDLARLPLDLNDVVLEVQRLLEDEFLIRKIRFKANLEGGLPAVLADRVQMQQVFVNLMRNGLDAIDARGGGPRLLVVSSRRLAEKAVLIEISDSGSGVRDVERMFDPFFTTKENGMGMGLAICRSIVKAHGGQLWVARNEPSGTTLSFSLPVSRDDRA
jgi:PAS domain S-box-containing protein